MPVMVISSPHPPPRGERIRGEGGNIYPLLGSLQKLGRTCAKDNRREVEGAGTGELVLVLTQQDAKNSAGFFL